MPQLYSIPSWFSEEYLRKMEEALAALETSFALEMADEEVLRYVHEHEFEGEYLVSLKSDLSRIVWSGAKCNIGSNAVIHASPTIYRHFFPSLGRESIEVFPMTPSDAERGALPGLLAESLVPEKTGVELVRDRINAFRPSELVAVRLVFGVMALRDDECGYDARSALSILLSS